MLFSFFFVVFGIGVGLVLTDLVLGGVGHGDADLDVEVDLDGDAGGDTSGLAWVGVGRVPLSVLIYSMLLGTGSTGMLFLGILGKTPFWWLSVPLSLLVAVFSTKLLGELLLYILPAEGHNVKALPAFIGSEGVLLTALEPDGWGEMKVDSIVPEYVSVISEHRLRAGESVIVVRVDDKRKVLVVEPLEV